MTITVTDSAGNRSNNSVHRIEIAWISDASGNASGNIPVNGAILRVEFIPGIGDSQPTDAYSVTLATPANIDVLNGSGASLSNVTGTEAVPTVGTTGLPRVIAGSLAFAVANAGNAKAGKLILYTR